LVEVTDIYLRQPSDNWNTVVRFTYCPAGKVVVGGSCNFNGWTNQQKQVITGAHATLGACFYALADAYDAANAGNLANSMVSKVFCVDAP